MGTYRLYCLDGVGKVASAEWIDLDAEVAGGAIEHRDDADAMAMEVAERLRDGRTCELWQGRRLVARLGSPPERWGPGAGADAALE